MVMHRALESRQPARATGARERRRNDLDTRAAAMREGGKRERADGGRRQENGREEVVWNERRAAMDVKMASILSLVEIRFDGCRQTRRGDALLTVTRCGNLKLCRSPPFSPRSPAAISSFLLLLRSCRPDSSQYPTLMDSSTLLYGGLGLVAATLGTVRSSGHLISFDFFLCERPGGMLDGRRAMMSTRSSLF